MMQLESWILNIRKETRVEKLYKPLTMQASELGIYGGRSESYILGRVHC